MRTGRAGGKLPFIFEQIVEIAIIPLDRIGGPGTFQPDVMVSAPLPLACVDNQPKPKASIGAPSGSGLTSASSPALHLPNVPAGDQRHGFFIIHRHAGEGFAHILCAQQRVGIAVGTLRVDINQTHLNSSQRIFQTVAFRHNGYPSQPVSHPNKYLLPDAKYRRGRRQNRMFCHPWIDRDIASEHEQVAQLMALPYFFFTGHNKRRALSRLPLSGQLLSGAKRCAPVPAPPRPSPVR